MLRNMNIVVIGGHTRNIGKTSVMVGLLQDLKLLPWTAVKITQYGHGICSRDGQPCGCAPTEHAFLLTEESNPRAQADTSRFLAAGARRSLWLRVRQGQLGEAIPTFLEALGRDDWIMIESNSILGFLEPSLYLMVLDSRQPDFKASAQEFLQKADALVSVGQRLDQHAWTGIDLRMAETRPTFCISAGTYSNPGLTEFVRQKLAANSGLDETLS